MSGGNGSPACAEKEERQRTQSFLVLGVKRQPLWLLFPWPKNYLSITFCLFYAISWVSFRKHCQLDDCCHAASSWTVSYGSFNFISQLYHPPFSSVYFKSPFMEAAGLPMYICMVLNRASYSVLLYLWIISHSNVNQYYLKNKDVNLRISLYTFC